MWVLIMLTGILVVALSISEQVKKNRDSINVLESSIRSSYDDNIRNEVESVVTLLDGINAKYEAGEFTLDEAKKHAADLVRGIRYGEDAYFWIDTVEGDNVVLLGRIQKERTDIIFRM